MSCKHVLLTTKNGGTCPICPAPVLDEAHVSKSATIQRLNALRARKSLARFFQLSWHVLEPGTPLLWNWHMESVCNLVQGIFENWWANGQGSNTVLNIPPGTAKSRMVSVVAPAWVWLHRPDYRGLYFSGNPRVATRDARYMHQLITSDWYQGMFQPAWKLRGDVNAATDFANTAGGFRQSKGIQEQVVGQRGDAIFVDDPHDPTQVQSDVQRQAVLDKYDQTIASRVNNLKTAIRFVIMQRLHEDDLSGHLIRQGYKSHCMPIYFDPARASSYDKRTIEGENLHPERFSEVVLAEQRKSLGSYGFSGQYEQNPAPKGGGLFKSSWWRFYSDNPGSIDHRPNGCSQVQAVALPKLESIVISVDAAFTKSETGSRVGLMVIGTHKANRYVLLDWTKPRTFKETCDDILQVKKQFPGVQKVYIEKKANGDAILDTLQPLLPGLIPLTPQGGKEARAAAISPTVESGNVYLLDGAAWLEDFVHEFSTFPNAKHDDRVDTLSQALSALQQPSDAHRLQMLAKGSSALLGY